MSTTSRKVHFLGKKEKIESGAMHMMEEKDEGSKKNIISQQSITS